MTWAHSLGPAMRVLCSHMVSETEDTQTLDSPGVFFFFFFFFVTLVGSDGESFAQHFRYCLLSTPTPEVSGRPSGLPGVFRFSVISVGLYLPEIRFNRMSLY